LSLNENTQVQTVIIYQFDWLLMAYNFMTVVKSGLAISNGGSSSDCYYVCCIIPFIFNVSSLLATVILSDVCDRIISFHVWSNNKYIIL